MKRFFKWAGIVAGGLLLMLILIGSLLVDSFNRRISKNYTVEPSIVSVPSDSASIELGKRWAFVLCAGCHGSDFSGTAFFNEPDLAIVNAPNLTPGTGGLPDYSFADWVRAIQHGVDPAGKPLFIMPSKDFNHLSVRDISAIVAFFQTVKPVNKTWNKDRQFTITGKVLTGLGAFGDVISAEVVDHQRKPIASMQPQISKEYGQYLVDVFGCRTCHGNNLAGGKDPNPKAPFAPSLIQGSTAGSWTETDFIRVMHTGETPEGRRLSDYMPWKSTAHMTNEELMAMNRYLKSLPGQY
jgi:mono/diheme cytochrome c family protein